MDTTEKKKSRDFNIYYLNFSKVYEIAMMINNVILTKIETDKSNSFEEQYGFTSSISAQGTKQFLDGIKASISKDARETSTSSSKVVESLDVKTTKSILLRRIIEQCASVTVLDSSAEGDLVKVDRVKLELLNEESLRQFLILRRDALKGMRVEGICLEHGLSIIEPSEPLKGSAVSRAEWEAEQKGEPTFRGMIRRDIETAIANSYTMRSFWQQLEQMGYTVKHGPNIVHPAVKPPGGQRFIRLDSQKLGYTEEVLAARLAAVRSGEVPSPVTETAPPPMACRLSPGRRYRVQGRIGRPRKLTGFRALYFKYLYLLGAIPSRRPGNRAAFPKESAYWRRTYYHKAFYSLDRGDGIEYDALFLSVTPWEVYERKVTLEELHAAITALPDKQAKRLNAYYFLGMSKTEIAKAEGVNKSQVSRSISRALESLKKYLKNLR